MMIRTRRGIDPRVGNYRTVRVRCHELIRDAFPGPTGIGPENNADGRALGRSETRTFEGY
jgi:hypothetical protein